MPKNLTDPATGKTVKLYSRRECGLPKSRAPKGNFQRSNAIAHHGVGRGNGLSLSACMSLWRGYHSYHARNKGWSDIGYTAGWCDAPDVGGALLEGRHWGKDGAHTQNGGNRLGYACCYIGDGRNAIADTAWRAWRAWLAHGLDVGAFTKSFKVTGHDDWYPKVCPGGEIKHQLQERSEFNTAETVDEEELIMEFGPPLTMAKDENDKWYLINNWEARYRYIKPEAWDTLKLRADDPDDKRYELRKNVWQSAWFKGMIYEGEV